MSNEFGAFVQMGHVFIGNENELLLEHAFVTSPLQYEW